MICAHTGRTGLTVSRLCLGTMSFGPRASEEESHAIMDHAYESLCAELGEEPAAVALAWLLHNPAVTAPIIGPRNVHQLQGSTRALKIELSEDVLERLDDVWPGPGGKAPEAYAW